MHLAHPPEPGQTTMDQMLTGLLTELFERYNGPLPRLAYVTDSGSNETGYFRKVLRCMVHPRTGKRLECCKTVFTQRLKNSGMRWSHDGAKTILTLRTILLSRSWSSTYSASLTAA